MLRDIRRASLRKRDNMPQSGDESSDSNSAPAAVASTSATPEPVPQVNDSSTNSTTMASASLGWISPQFTKLFGRSRATSTSSSKGVAPSSAGPLDSSSDKLNEDQPGGPSHAESESAKQGSSMRRMEDRVLDEMLRLFGDTGMLFSYSYDLTRALQGKEGHALDSAGVPLALTADADYWFNHHLQQPLLVSGAIEWAVPLVQGSIQMAMCEVPRGASFKVCVLSRRNRQRIGMRYERRGANEQGHVANFVETEQILTVAASGQQTHYTSFVQTRGSIPFFWKQPPTGLHPVPVIAKSDEENIAVCAAHLQREIGRSGRQVLLSLVEHKGREAVLGAKYACLVGQCVADELVDACMVRYVPWDFHHETRGMHYEKLELLLSQLQREISDMVYHWRVGDQVLTRQHGVFRVNCMDCLDRTNVVQSTIARWVLNEQLVRLGVHIAPERGLDAYQGLQAMLNNLWANNGDYISCQYAGTMAMKGDFTRTGKRNFGGLMNDASYSLARLWISTFRDYFSQSVLDFALGNQKASDVFRTILDLRSREPDYALQLSRTREAAIEASIAIVVHDGECVLLACIVHTPMALNTRKLRGGADAVMVLTDAAVYICSYDYQLEKVSQFWRVELAGMSKVQHGAYITDILAPHSLDTTRNHGVVLYFATTAALPTSVTVAPVGYSSPKPAGSSSAYEGGSSSHPATAATMVAISDEQSAAAAATPSECFIACKLASEVQVVMQSVVPVLPNGADSSTPLTRLGALEGQSPELLAECLCSAIQSSKSRAGPVDASKFIVESPIISAATAKQNTSLVDKVSNRLYKALWA
ncbi:hypothetical protein GGI20_001541 [Coemansia sp. BCRC 34301]|nr:hypothetical protein GGI20_001541 [Coemansia sp. BCRC 34301]